MFNFPYCDMFMDKGACVNFKVCGNPGRPALEPGKVREHQLDFTSSSTSGFSHEIHQKYLLIYHLLRLSISVLSLLMTCYFNGPGLSPVPVSQGEDRSPTCFRAGLNELNAATCGQSMLSGPNVFCLCTFILLQH